MQRGSKSRRELALKEERTKLKTTLDAINGQILHLENNMPFPGVGRYSVSSSGDERSNLQHMKAVNLQVQAQISALAEFTASPYFARMDVQDVDTQDLERMYVGEKALVLDGRVMVFDWRSPLGQRYYLKHELEFRHENHSFDLLLRRALDVRKGQLVSLNDEYIFGEDVFKDGVTDPFLISVLRDKRRQYRLTNIIRTIQSTQNEIIRHPLGGSLVVQGCAGSGKTVIMLHRLSFMKFNHPNMDWGRVKIIAPHANFDMHLSQLAAELELDKIPCVTYESYCLTLLSSYAEDRWSSVNHMELVPEREMPDGLISQVYNRGQLDDCRSSYSTVVLDRSRQVDTVALRTAALTHGLEWPDMASMTNARRFARLASIADSIHSRHRKANAEQQRLRKQHIRLLARKSSGKRYRLQHKLLTRSEIDKMREERTSLVNKLLDARSLPPIKSERRLPSRVVALWEKYRQRIADLRDTKATLLNEIDDVNIEIVKQHSAYESNTAVLAARTAEANALMERDQQALASLGFIAVFRRRELIGQIRRWQRMLDEIKRDEVDQRGSHQREQALLDNRLRSNKGRLAEIEGLIVDDEDENRLGKLFQSLFFLELSADRTMGRGLVHVSFRLRPKIDRLRTRATRSRERIDEAGVYVLSKDQLAKVAKARAALSVLNQDLLFADSYGAALRGIEQGHGVTNAPLTRYRLLWWLDFYQQHAGLYSGVKDTVLTIDEGQEFAPVEYELLRGIHGENLVLNVYGDLNQRSSPRGIHSWDELAKVTTHKRYKLTENYRNTNQITEFCNNELEMSVQPIGIRGGPVSLKSTVEALRDVSKLVSLSGEERVAVIVSNADGPLAEQFIARGCVQGQIASGKVSLLTVEEAKGLEFETVFACDVDMTKQAKYIAYTRALKKLNVVRY